MPRRKGDTLVCKTCHSDESPEWHQVTGAYDYVCNDCFLVDRKRKHEGETTDKKLKKTKPIDTPLPKPHRRSLTGTNGNAPHRNTYRWGRGNLSSQDLLFIMSGTLRYLMHAERQSWDVKRPWDRWLVTQFLRLPERDEFPEYFHSTKNPMDFKTILDQIERGHYTNIHEFETDIGWVLYNTMHYYGPETQIYQDAKQLTDMFEAFKDDIVDTLNSIYDARSRRGPDDSRPLKQILHEVYDALVNEKSPTGHRYCDSLMRVPSSRANAAYHSTVKTLIDLTTIKEKIDKNEYTSFADYDSDNQLLFANTMLAFPEDSTTHKDAVHLQQFFSENSATYKRASEVAKAIGIVGGPEVIEQMDFRPIRDLYEKRLKEYTSEFNPEIRNRSTFKKGKKAVAKVGPIKDKIKPTPTSPLRHFVENIMGKRETRSSSVMLTKGNAEEKEVAVKESVEPAKLEFEGRATRSSSQTVNGKTEKEKTEKVGEEEPLTRSARKRKLQTSLKFEAPVANESAEGVSGVPVKTPRRLLVLKADKRDHNEASEMVKDSIATRATSSRRTSIQETIKKKDPDSETEKEKGKEFEKEFEKDSEKDTKKDTEKNTEKEKDMEKNTEKGKDMEKEKENSSRRRSLVLSFSKVKVGSPEGTQPLEGQTDLVNDMDTFEPLASRRRSSRSGGKKGEGEVEKANKDDGNTTNPKTTIKFVMGRGSQEKITATVEQVDDLPRRALGDSTGRGSMKLRVKALMGKEGKPSQETGRAIEGEGEKKTEPIATEEGSIIQQDPIDQEAAGITRRSRRTLHIVEGTPNGHTDNQPVDNTPATVQTKITASTPMNLDDGDSQGGVEDEETGGRKRNKRALGAQQEHTTVEHRTSRTQGEDEEATSLRSTRKKIKGDIGLEIPREVGEEVVGVETTGHPKDHKVAGDQKLRMQETGGSELSQIKLLGEGGEAVGGHVGRLLRQIQATTEWTIDFKVSQDYHSRTEAVLRRGQILWHILDTCVGEDGHRLCTPLHKDKSSKIPQDVVEYLDMDIVWKELERTPEDMHTCKITYPGMKEQWCRMCQIKKRCALQGYRDLEKIHKDLLLIVLNAMHRTDEGSQLHKDCKALLEVIDQGIKGFVYEDISYTLLDVLLAAKNKDGLLCEEFCILPSRTDYADYYEVISQPMDLYTIIRKLIGGRYVAQSLANGLGSEGVLKLFEADVGLIFDNAQVYNEDDSMIYQDASQLRSVYEAAKIKIANPETITNGISRTVILYDVVINQTKRLKITFFKPKPTDNSENIAKINLRRTSESAKRIVKAISKEKELEKERERLKEKLRERDGEMEKEKPKERKRGRGRGKERSEDEYGTEGITEITAMRDLMLEIENAVGSTGNCKLVDLLWKGSERTNQLTEIMKMIGEEDGYKDFNHLIDDLCAYFKLAKKNQPDGSASQQAAIVLGELCLTKANDLRRALGKKLKKRRSSGSLPASGLLNLGGKELRKVMSMLYKTIVKAHRHGEKVAEVFRELPDAEVYDDYYDIIKTPIALDVIKGRMDANPPYYTTLQSFVDDFEVMFQNAQTYNEDGSDVFRDAQFLRNLLNTKINELKTNEPKLLEPTTMPLAKEDDTMPRKGKKKAKRRNLSADQIEEAKREYKKREKKGPISMKELGFCLMRTLVQLVVEARREDGKLLCEPILTIPARDLNPKYHEVVKVPISLQTIHDKVNSSQYESMQQLYADMFLLFYNAYSVLQAPDQAYFDVLTLHKLFLGTYFRLWRPYQAEMVVKAEVDAWHDVIGRLEKAPRDPIKAATAVNTTPALEQPGVEELTINNMTIRLGMFVYLPSGNPICPQIVCVQRLWTDETNQKWLWGTWLSRPYECFNHNTKYNAKEVYWTSNTRSNHLSLVQGECQVMQPSDWCNYKPVGIATDDIYVCEYVYHDRKGFEKIKKWMYGVDRVVADKGGVTYEKRAVPITFQRDLCNIDLQYRLDWINPMDRDRNILSPGDGDGTHPGYTYYRQLFFKNMSFKKGDFVYLKSDDPANHYVVKIEQMWIDENGGEFIYGNWYLRPYETSHRPTATFYALELLKETEKDVNTMHSIVARVAVLLPKEYMRGRPYGIPEDDVFVSDSVYDSKVRTIKKINLTGLARPDSQLCYEDGYMLLAKPLESIPRVVSPLVSAQGTVGGQSLASTAEQYSSGEDDSGEEENKVMPNTAGKGLVEDDSMQSVAPTLSPIPPSGPVYHCRWGSCRTQLVDATALWDHIYQLHLTETNMSHHCSWLHCGKDSTRRSNLMAHIRRVHINNDSYPHAMGPTPPPAAPPSPPIPEFIPDRPPIIKAPSKPLLVDPSPAQHGGLSLGQDHPIAPPLAKTAALQLATQVVDQQNDVQLTNQKDEDVYDGPKTLGRALARAIRLADELHYKSMPRLSADTYLGPEGIKHTDRYMLYAMEGSPSDGEGNENDSDSGESDSEMVVNEDIDSHEVGGTHAPSSPVDTQRTGESSDRPIPTNKVSLRRDREAVMLDALQRLTSSLNAEVSVLATQFH